MTSHFASPSIRVLNIPAANCPLLTRPAPFTHEQYRPSRFTTAVTGEVILVEATWAKGRANEDGCSPVHTRIEVPITRSTSVQNPDDVRRTPNFTDAKASALRTDPFLGVEESIRLHPAMAEGFLASLEDHFNPSHQKDRTGNGSTLDTKVDVLQDAFRLGLASVIEPLIDSRVERNGAHVTISPVTLRAPATKMALV